jgi:hypothetical protein
VQHRVDPQQLGVPGASTRSPHASQVPESILRNGRGGGRLWSGRTARGSRPTRPRARTCGKGLGADVAKVLVQMWREVPAQMWLRSWCRRGERSRRSVCSCVRACVRGKEIENKA